MKLNNCIENKLDSLLVCKQLLLGVLIKREFVINLPLVQVFCTYVLFNALIIWWTWKVHQGIIRSYRIRRMLLEACIFQAAPEVPQVSPFYGGLWECIVNSALQMQCKMIFHRILSVKIGFIMLSHYPYNLY